MNPDCYSRKGKQLSNLQSKFLHKIELPFGLLCILDLNTIFLSELLNFTYIDLLFFAVVFAGAFMIATETQRNKQSIHLEIFIPI